MHDETSRNPQLLARLVGAAFLASLIIGILSVFFLSGSLIDTDNPGQTLVNMKNQEQAARISAVVEIALGVLELIVAFGLYALLYQAGRWKAGLMAASKTVSAAMHGVAALFSMLLIYLATEQHYAEAFSPDQMGALASLLTDAQSNIFHTGLLISSFGAAISFIIFFETRLIPRIISGWGIFASFGVIVSIAAMRIDPSVSNFVYPYYVLANLIAYVSLTGWLIIFGVNVDQFKGDKTPRMSSGPG